MEVTHHQSPAQFQVYVGGKVVGVTVPAGAGPGTMLTLNV